MALLHAIAKACRTRTWLEWLLLATSATAMATLPFAWMTVWDLGVDHGEVLSRPRAISATSVIKGDPSMLIAVGIWVSGLLSVSLLHRRRLAVAAICTVSALAFLVLLFAVGFSAFVFDPDVVQDYALTPAGRVAKFATVVTIVLAWINALDRDPTAHPVELPAAHIVQSGPHA
ncbi:MAG: hypothetical protein AB7O24_05205 [Kofleriaceae bacterium]